MLAVFREALKRHVNASHSGDCQEQHELNHVVSSHPQGAEHEFRPRVLVQLPNMCVLWKPAGWTVTVTVARNLLLHQLPDMESGPATAVEEMPLAAIGSDDLPLQDWLAQTLGKHHSIARQSTFAHGLVHRLDKDTSGPLLWGSNIQGFYAAQLEFVARRVRKEYICLCHGCLRHGPQLLQSRLLDSQMGGKTVIDSSGQAACTEVLAVDHLLALDGKKLLSLILVRIHTGRRHQIRAHLSNEGHPLVGDVVYGGAKAHWCPRHFLHSCKLCFDVGDGPHRVLVPLPPQLQEALASALPLSDCGRATHLHWLRP